MLLLAILLAAACDAHVVPVLHGDQARREIIFVPEAMLATEDRAGAAVIEARSQIAAVRDLGGRCMQPVHYDIDAQSAGTMHAGMLDPAKPGHLIACDDCALRVEQNEVVVPSRLNLGNEPRVPLARLRATAARRE